MSSASKLQTPFPHYESLKEGHKVEQILAACQQGDLHQLQPLLQYFQQVDPHDRSGWLSLLDTAIDIIQMLVDE